MITIRNGSPALVLAPMEGVTDAPMRALFAEGGGFSFCVAEFLRISQQVPPLKTFEKHMPELANGALTHSGLPVQLQLLGGDPEMLAQAALAAVASRATAIDLNFGCPARTVNRRDGGASLLRYPERIRTIVHTVRQSLPVHIPLSVKLRLGWDDPEAIHHNADRAVEGGAAWITIHGRTRMQGYKPPAFWHPIGEIRRRLGIPVVANGDIWTLADLQRCRDETSCEHFMLGRGAMADPNLPRQAAAELGLIKSGAVPPVDWGALVTRFVQLAENFSDRRRYLPGRLKQWIKMSHLRFPHACYDRIKTMDNVDAMLTALQDIS